MGTPDDGPFQAALAAEYAALVRTVSEIDGRLLTVKSWSVTLSLAGIGLAFQQQHYALFGLAAGSGACFWAVEAMTKRHQVRYYPRMRQIEAWSADHTGPTTTAGVPVSAPRIDWAWTAAGRRDPAAALDEPPRAMTSEQIRRMLAHTVWLPHVFVPSAFAVVAGVLLTVLAAVGVIELPL